MSKKGVGLQEQDKKNIAGGNARGWPVDLNEPSRRRYPDGEDRGKLVKTVQTLEEALQEFEKLRLDLKDKKET